jgi:hypothetical protein
MLDSREAVHKVMGSRCVGTPVLVPFCSEHLTAARCGEHLWSQLLRRLRHKQNKTKTALKNKFHLKGEKIAGVPVFHSPFYHMPAVSP